WSPFAWVVHAHLRFAILVSPIPCAGSPALPQEVPEEPALQTQTEPPAVATPGPSTSRPPPLPAPRTRAPAPRARARPTGPPRSPQAAAPNRGPAHTPPGASGRADAAPVGRRPPQLSRRLARPAGAGSLAGQRTSPVPPHHPQLGEAPSGCAQAIGQAAARRCQAPDPLYHRLDLDD